VSEDKISKTIIEQATSQAEEIIKEAKDKAAKIKKKAAEGLKKLEEKINAEEKQTYEREKDRIISLADLDIRLTDLTEKRNLLQDVFDKVLESLCNRDKKYQDRLKKTILSAADTGSEQIKVSKEDRKLLTDSFLKKLSKEFDKGKGFTKSDKNVDIKGGVLLTEGEITIDASFETIVDEERYYLETEIANILFGENN